MARVLESPNQHARNVHLYHNHGRILGGIFQNGSITGEDLYEMCGMFLVFSAGPWAIFHLNANTGATGTLLQNDQARVSEGSYVLLSPGASHVEVDLTRQRGRRRPYSSSHTRHRPTRLQTHFRDTLRERDGVCVITGSRGVPVDPYFSLEAAHVFPIALETEWNQQGFETRIADISPAALIGENKIYSSQNGLLLHSSVHHLFDAYFIAINPRDNYKIIAFQDLSWYGASFNPDGSHLQTTATNPQDPRRVNDDVLWWHFRQAVLLNMKGVAGEPNWEHDLDSDDIGEIMEGPAPAERMEAELFSRLGVGDQHVSISAM